MEFELECVSSQGAQFVELAEKHAADFAPTADRYDRENAFPEQNWVELRRSGFLSGTVPEDLGGIGVFAIRDLVVAISRLARGDGSTAIGTAMHLTAFWYLARLRAAPAWPAFDLPQRQLALLLRACARGRAVACVAISERGTSLGYPKTAATTTETGFQVSGRKSFCTNSPAATMFLSTVHLRTGQDTDALGFAVIPRETPGLTVLQNWDALGMRASGSGDVVLDNCRVGPGMVLPAGPYGVLSAAILPLAMVGALVLASAFLGIAEQANEFLRQAMVRARGGAAGATPAARPAIQALVGENGVDLAVARSVLSRTADVLDDCFKPGAPAMGAAALTGLMAEVQSANMAAKRAAIATVDRCLTASGGAGYLSANPMSRLYRDVRAGLFMQPFSALDAFEFIGSVKLGLDPDPGRPDEGR